jgi:hypothetical protein
MLSIQRQPGPQKSPVVFRYLYGFLNHFAVIMCEYWLSLSVTDLIISSFSILQPTWHALKHCTKFCWTMPNYTMEVKVETVYLYLNSYFWNLP